MKKILFLVVLYKTHPEASSTIISLSEKIFEKYGIEPSFAIWDNSLDGYGEHTLKHLPGPVKYYHYGVNEKLSVAYNRIVFDSDDVDWFVFLDDDSLIDDEYLSSLPEFFSSNTYIAVPKISFNDTVISPGQIRSIKGKRLPGYSLLGGVMGSKNIVAMMSGTVVSRDVFVAGLKFDERLSFYGVDTRFFIDYSKRFSQLFLLSATMVHHSALRDNLMPVNEQVVRHKKLAEAWSIIFDDVKCYQVKLFFYIIYYALKLSVVRRNISFLRVGLSIFHLFKTKAKSS
ncbi:glycosyltransferase [Zobellella sp. DQSA1]|uniref:glycosyltransferase n=1 Tax=Zobellella sp. DQSA1 TaxID=3342386 RepID=UPI0035BF4F53